jgi:hypothetical protein
MRKTNGVPKKGTRKTWARPAVRKVGTVGEVLQAGGGKLSIQANDPGEVDRKPKGGE